MTRIKNKIHVADIATLANKKMSANETNTSYTLGLSGEVTNGTPDVLYQQVVFIKSTRQIWTHGVLYCVTDYNDLRNKPLIAVGNGFMSGKINQIIESMKEEYPEQTELVESYYRPYVGGNNAFALGVGSRAEGDYSLALGMKSIAKGESSVAVGFNSRVECTITRDYDYDNQSIYLYVRYDDFIDNGVDTTNLALDDGNGIYVEQGARVEQEEGEEEQEQEIVLTLSHFLYNEYKKGDKIVLVNGSFGENSYTEGWDCLAFNKGHASGNNVKAIGDGSYAVGGGTEAKNDKEFACGAYNKSSKENGKRTRFSVGVGTYQERKNALEIVEDGKVYVKGLGGYDGTNASGQNVKHLVTIINELAQTVATLRNNMEQNEIVTATAINNLRKEIEKNELVVATAFGNMRKEIESNELVVATALGNIRKDIEEDELVTATAIGNIGKDIENNELVVATAFGNMRKEIENNEKVVATAFGNVRKEIENNELVTATALGDVQKNIENNELVTATALGNIQKTVEDNELVTATALGDVQKTVEDNEKVSATAINDINSRLS